MRRHDQVSADGDGEPVPAGHTSHFFARPATRAGNRAGVLALISFAALLTSAVGVNAFERRALGDVFDVVKPLLIVIFALSGFGALALSLRGLKGGERSYVVWAAFVVGLFATALMIAEFTVME